MTETLFGRGGEIHAEKVFKALGDLELMYVAEIYESDDAEIDVESISGLVSEKCEYYGLTIDEMQLVLEQMRSVVRGSKV